MGLLLSKQDSLKAEHNTLAHRLEQLDGELASLPDASFTLRVASLTRLRLTLEHTGKDWRKLPYDDVRAFLFHLFGETTVASGTGVFVGRDKRGGLVAKFKGRVEMHHDLTNGRPVSKAFQNEADRLNAEIRRVFEQGKPSPAYQSPRLSALLSHNILKLAGKTIQYDVLAVLSLGVFAS